MSRNTKIVLGIVGGVVLLCACVGIGLTIAGVGFMRNFSENGLVEDPAEAEAVAREIVDYQLPEGYSEAMAMNFLGIRIAFISTGGDFNAGASNGVVMIMQFPAALAGNEAQMRQQMEQAFNQQGNADLSVEEVGEQTVTINGEPALMTILEGTDDSGNGVRQLITAFSGKNGDPAMMMIFGQLSNWDQAKIDAFIGSME